MPDPITPAAVDTGVTAPAGDAWYAGADADTIGYLQNRGLTDKTPAEVALASIKAHREAEKMIGAPADQFLRKPKDAADEASHAALRSYLGVPKDAAEYKFDGVEGLDQTSQDFLRGLASKLEIPTAKAVELAQEFVKRDTAISEAAKADITAKTQEGLTALKANWGQNYDANMVVAKNALNAVLGEAGIKPEEVALAISSLEGQVGYKAVMETFRAIGMKMGEDRFVSNDSRQGLMTKDGAQARLNELKADQGWTKRLMEGDVSARKEFDQLSMILAEAA